jgi:hypothetical protein
MVRRKDSFWEYAKELENGRFSCNFCKQDFAGGISRIKSHLSGVRGRDIQICLQVPEAIQLVAQQALQAIDAPTKRAKFVITTNNGLVGESISSSSSSHMPNLCKAQDMSKVDKQFAKLFISNGIFSDVLQSPLFKDFVNGIAEHGPGYELPSSLTLKSRLIPDIKKEVEEYVENVIKDSVNKPGCTLMYNLWTSRTLVIKHMDIFAYTPIGVACMYPPDRISGDIHFFEQTMSSIMELIGPTNVVQFIIHNQIDYHRGYNDINDDGSDEVSSTKAMLSRKYPWIYQTSCANSGIELLLRKIYNVPFVCNTIQVAEWIVLYIYKHKVNVSIRRVHKKRDFFASNFLMLKSLLEVESEFQALQVSIVTLSSDWGKPLNEKQAAGLFRGANFIDYAIRCKEFWSRGKIIAQVMQPLFQARCLVRCEGPTSGYLYEMMERVQDAFKQCCDNNYVLYDVIWKIVNEVRYDIIRPIHAAAAFLNPIYMCSEKFKENVEMVDGINYMVEHLVAVEEKETFMSQVQLYRMKVSSLFTTQAMIMLKTSHPRKFSKFCFFCW